MPGRPLIDNDRKEKTVTMYMSERELQKIDNYVAAHHLSHGPGL